MALKARRLSPRPVLPINLSPSFQGCSTKRLSRKYITPKFTDSEWKETSCRIYPDKVEEVYITPSTL